MKFTSRSHSRAGSKTKHYHSYNSETQPNYSQSATTLPEQSPTTSCNEWRNLSKIARLNLIESILIEHPSFEQISQEIEYCLQYGSDELETTNPPCLVILGSTGAGKTTLLLTFVDRKPSWVNTEGNVIPYLYIVIPRTERASRKKVLSVMLRALGDPNYERGTEVLLQQRLYWLLKACRVQAIFIDEFQHLVNRDNHKVLHDAADFIKDLINETHRPIILAGQLGEAEKVLKSNPQLERRVRSPLILRPLDWDHDNPQTIKTFCEILNQLDKALPFDHSGLGEVQMAYRMHWATDGYIGWIMDIVRYSANLAIEQNCDTLHLAHFDQAYQRCIEGTEMGNANPSRNRNIGEAQRSKSKDNPFSKEFKLPSLVKTLESFVKQWQTSPIRSPK